METKNYQNHPTVRAFGLRTFISKYDNQRCCISGTAVQVGEPIANIVPILDRLQAFGLVKTKSFKYAAVANLPLAASAEEVTVLKDVADRMVAATDPEWPLDNIGCSRSTYGPVASWVASGYNPFGATRAARYLQMHLGTQIEKESVEGQTILTVANRKWNGQGSNDTTANTSTDTDSKPAEKPVVEKAPAAPTTKIGDRPVKIAATRRQGEILIAANGEGLKLFLDPPWTTPAHAVIKDAIKAQGARWDPEPKCWRIGVSALMLHLDLLDGQPLTVTPEAYKLLQDALGCQRSSNAVDTTDTVKQRIDAVLPDGKRLYPFQYVAVEFVEKAGGRALLAEEMGLGKSIETLGYLALHPELRPAVLVVPAVVTSNWRREANTWRPTETVQVLKTGKDTINPDATILVVTYDLLKKHIDAIKALNPKAVVGDEVHLVKNYKTARAASFCSLAKHPSVKAMIGLSGTPIVNRPVEFFTFLHLLRPSDFGSWRRFTERYCDGHEENVARGKWVYVAKGATNTDELNQRLRSFMIRRTKEQVLTELPPKTRTITDVEMTPAERREYRGIEGENALATITAQRQFVGRVKVRAAIEWIEQYADTNTPLLVFAHHHDVLDALQEGCRTLGVRFGRIDGSVSQEQRGRLVDDFQAGKTDVMLLSTKAAGVGITLTRASNVLVVERQFTPGDEVQAEDRCHRIGQASAVTIRYLMVNDTVDADMAELIESKRLVLDAVLNGTAAPQDLDIRAELVARMEQRNAK
jgi:SWI/SNF-related matrix-associated actin-dependent regulator 1 of chromatin subfamily A